ncbi:MAG: leucine--tRNA ligase [candidate division WOR-3 bacterium]
MKLEYNFPEIEKKWQKRWEEAGIFRTPTHPKNKYYCLVMYAYPSGDLHMGHIKNYVIGDVVARTKRQEGKDVLHPFGWDAFGLPAENAAIIHKVHPEVWTKENIRISKEHLIRLGISYDWEREIWSFDPNYYKWNQYFFLKFYERGLAYRKGGWVNWCPGCQTVLANEQVVEGRCYRGTCNAIVEKRKLEQWFFKITAYAERLWEGIDQLEGWPENVKIMQRNWIGRSEGVEVSFPVLGTNYSLNIFTTRPDTLYGVTFMAIAPDAEITEELIRGTEEEEKIRKFIERILKKSEIERQAIGREKEGIFIGRYCENPLSKEKIPIFIADYVLASYGTGCIMAVPAHDQRDFEFAKKYNLPIRVVIKPFGCDLKEGEMGEAYTGEGIMVNSGPFSGKSSPEGIKLITDYLVERGIGKRKVNYRLRDWLISRQRYWGTPIPMIHCERCGIVPVPEEDLPVLLPEKVEDYLPKGKSVLAGVADFINTTCPKCRGKAKRDPDTMDTFVDSSWYFLRYLDPRNEKLPFTYEATKEWLPIDKYIGGIEHACGHLIFFRFFTKVLYDMGLCAYDEPCLSLFTQGMVLLDGKVMSSSRKHGVWVGPFLEEHGADVARLGILFAAPPEKDLDWKDELITGAKRFLNRIYRLFAENNYQIRLEMKREPLSPSEKKLYIRLNQTIKKVKEDNEKFQFNTAIAALMEFLNDLTSFPDKESEVFRFSLYNFLILLSPFAPHLAEELWERAKGKGFISSLPFPNYDSSAIKFPEVEIPIQINGKLRSKIVVPLGSEEAEVKRLALEESKIKNYIAGKEIKKIIYIKDKLLNIVLD